MVICWICTFIFLPSILVIADRIAPQALVQQSHRLILAFQALQSSGSPQQTVRRPRVIHHVNSDAKEWPARPDDLVARHGCPQQHLSFEQQEVR